jgi:hypothetical protein
MDFLGVKNYSDLITNKDKKTIENDIKSFLVYLREKRKITYVSAGQYLNAVKKFYYVNSDYDLKWSLIKMYLGNDDTDDYDSSYTTIQGNPSNDDGEKNGIDVEADRPYTRAEIQKMLTTATDPRVKIVILLMSSSGIRIGGIPQLKLRNLTTIEKFNKNIYQIHVYEKSRKFNYKTFCTPECASVIDSYLNYRKHAGENLNGNSPLIREQFNPQDHFKLNNPRHIGIGAIKYLVNEVLIKHSALKQKIEYDYENKRNKKRHSTMLTHSLRKYFDTESRKAGIYPDFVELLMGHKLPGVRKHYFKPDMNILLEGTKECKGYVAAIDSLTINDENRLKRENQELKQQDDYQKYVIDKKIKEMEEQNKILSQKLIKYEEHVKYIKECEQKIDAIIESKFEEQNISKEYESIPVEDKKRKDSVFKNVLEMQKKRIKHENDYENLLREGVDNDYYY